MEPLESGMMASGYGVSLGGNEKILEQDNGDGCL